MITLNPTQKRQLKRLENQYALQAKEHDELRHKLDAVQQTCNGQQSLIDTLSNTPGDDHRDEITALSSRLDRVKQGAQSGWDRLANLEQQLSTSRTDIEALSAQG
jgi:uncharacterized coiled-coil protein SlyX